MMNVYAYDIVFNVKDKQGNLLYNHPVVLKLKNNTGFFLEEDDEGLLNGTPVQTKEFVSSNIGRVTARMYFKTPESVDILQEIVSEDVVSITPIELNSNLLSLDFNDTVMVGQTVDFSIKCTDPELNGISETIDILVNDTYYDSVQTDIIGNANYTYNNTGVVGLQVITIECTGAESLSKDLEVVEDESV